jgi:hypothetical protein
MASETGVVPSGPKTDPEIEPMKSRLKFSDAVGVRSSSTTRTGRNIDMPGLPMPTV